MSEYSIVIKDLGKMYRLYRQPNDKLVDAFGLNAIFFWRDKRYQEFWALREMNLEVKKGERLGIIGRNGAGKSTLLKIIAQNVSPTEGKVIVNGRIQALMELGTGFHPEFTGRQNIRASLSYQGFNDKKIADLEEGIVDFAELYEFIDQPIKTYSAGMYARLAFTVATAIEPEILIIDEVMGAGDAYFAGKSIERMRNLTEDSGVTVLFVSHDLGSIQQLCNRVIWIDRGKIIADGNPLEVTKRYYASILQQEEMRLKVKNTRILSRHKPIETKNDYREIVFRFITADGQLPKQPHPVRKISLVGEAGYVQTVELGAPMDNDRNQTAFILADPKYMLWSEPRTVFGERVRSIEDTGGLYRHAPIVFLVPSEIWEDNRFELSIVHCVNEEEVINVDMIEGESYKTLGILSHGEGFRTDSFKIPDYLTKDTFADESVLQGKEPVDNNAQIQDKWRSSEAEFLSVKTVDSKECEKFIFKPGETICLKVDMTVNEMLPKCWLDAVIYDDKGNKVCLLVYEILNPIMPGNVLIEAVIENPNLRQGEYVVSIELLKNYDPQATEKMPFYCHWNRCVLFRIDEGYTGNVSLGLVKFDFKVRMKNYESRC